jgi:NAD(P)-dependent dehydrogenase (short-subunit alcohol dehydrogenase family)
MKGQICIVTGANAGIGKVTATDLARRGATVVMLCRNQAKAEAARQEILAQTGNANVDIIVVDFASQASIHQAADQFLGKYSSLHVLVNNAGFLAGTERTETPDGIEQTFAVNHLGYFLLTARLLPVLRTTAATAPVRIISVASEAHRFGVKFEVGNLQLRSGYSGIKAYCLSKCCNILFTVELARRLAEAKLDITANCLHPGGVNSNFGGQADGWFGWMFSLMKPFFISMEQGAATSIFLATAPEVASVSGKYFNKKKVISPSATAANPHYARLLWEASEELTKVKFL